MNNPSITSPRDGARNLRSRSPRDITGRRYEELHREATERKKIQADPEGYARQARQEGYDRGYAAGDRDGYAKGAEAGLACGWDDCVSFLVNAGLVTQDAVDQAVDAYNEKLATDDAGSDA